MNKNNFCWFTTTLIPNKYKSEIKGSSSNPKCNYIELHLKESAIEMDMFITHDSSTISLWQATLNFDSSFNKQFSVYWVNRFCIAQIWMANWHASVCTNIRSIKQFPYCWERALYIVTPAISYLYIIVNIYTLRETTLGIKKLLSNAKDTRLDNSMERPCFLLNIGSNDGKLPIPLVSV